MSEIVVGAIFLFLCFLAMWVSGWDKVRMEVTLKLYIFAIIMGLVGLCMIVDFMIT